MRNPLPIVIALALLAFLLVSGSPSAPGGFFPTCRPGKVPHNMLVPVPEPYRARNWGASCVWSSTVSMLRSIGDHQHADWIRRNRAGGAGPARLNATLDQLGVPYAYTVDGDARLFEWALKHNRPVGIGYGAYHAQLLLGRQDGYAVILNNFSNATKVYRVEWQEFLRRWRSCPPSGGWAWTVVPRGVIPPPEVPFSRGA